VVFEESRSWLATHIGEWGTVADDADYRRVLCGSHVVLSTALHEFQGLAVQEAVACGCLPLVPDRLAYPEFFPVEYRYASHPLDADREAEELGRHLLRLAEQQNKGALPQPPAVTRLDWSVLAARYDEVILETAGR
jgi:hypothetical protein